VPEGDSIRRIAAQLAPLANQMLERVTTQGLARAIAGRTVTAIDPHGKHLVLDLDDGTQVRVHLGMNGRFRRYPRAEGEATLARISPGRASLAIVVADAVYLWTQARTVEIAARRAPLRGMAVAALGPDVLADDFDSRLAASRARLHASRSIADVLLDQRVVAGIGNIYKCEALFLCGVDPRTPIARLADERIAAIYQAARTLMQASVRGALAPAEPFRGDRYHVYSRGGQPCGTCETPIVSYQWGEIARWTWQCPHCQAANDHAAG
jgi:endonuclease VIII